MSSSHDPKIAPLNVCNQCKRRKKKCDKRLPTCGRCSKFGIQCQYPSDLQEILSLSSDSQVTGLDKTIPLHRYAATGSAAVSLPALVSPFAFVMSLPGCSEGSSLLGGQLRLLDLDEQLTMQAYEVMTRNGDEIAAACERFFMITEKWLPVIDKTEFLIRLGNLQTSPNAPFSTLVMSMFLYAQQSSPVSGRSTRVESLYYTTKCFYSLLLSSGGISLDLLKAGLLIAAYEHFQSMYDASGLSIGVCARMGYSLRLHRTVQPGSELESMPKRDLEERRRLWWAIFILERTMAIEHVESRIPFACQILSLNQHLPSDSVRIDQNSTTAHPVECHTPISFDLRNGSFSWLGPYPREAQAAYLLSLVIDHIIEDDAEQEQRQQQADDLDGSLQSLLMSMLEPPTVYARGDYCGAYSICMSAIMCLHQNCLSKKGSWSNLANDDSSSRSLLAVETTSMMLLEATASSMTSNPVDWDTIPVWSISSLYIAALVRIKLSCGFTDAKEREMELSPARTYLQYFASRYQIAADHLKGIEKALESYNG